MRGSGTPGSARASPTRRAVVWTTARNSGVLRRSLARRPATPRPPLSEETGLMRELRKKSGPFASDATLRAHLRAARGKLHWSMNGYFRQAVLDADPRAKCDFEPRPLASDRPAVEPAEGVSSSTTTTTRAERRTFPRLPLLVWEMILRARSRRGRVPARSSFLLHPRRRARPLRVASPIRLPMGRRRRVSRLVSRKPGRSRLVRRVPSPPRQRRCDDVSRVSRHARHAHRLRLPLPALVSALRRGRVLLGGDYLVDGDPAWGCRACHSRWLRWPFAWPDVGPEQIERNMPAPGLSGARGGARGAGVDLGGRDAHRRDGEPKRRTSDRTGRRERHERVESE